VSYLHELGSSAVFGPGAVCKKLEIGGMLGLECLLKVVPLRHFTDNGTGVLSMLSTSKTSILLTPDLRPAGIVAVI